MIHEPENVYTLPTTVFFFLYLKATSVTSIRGQSGQLAILLWKLGLSWRIKYATTSLVVLTHFLFFRFFLKFSEIIFIDHQTGNKAYFKRRSRLSVTAASNYNKPASTYGLWDGEGVNKNYSYQLLICDNYFYSEFFVSGYKKCFKQCDHWCGDTITPYFRTASTTSAYYKGVAFNINGHHPHVVGNRLISVGLR